MLLSVSRILGTSANQLLGQIQTGAPHGLQGITWIASRGLRGISPKEYRQERVVETPDGSMLVCWHPEPKFPYEMTRPMPKRETTSTDSKMKVQYVKDMEDLYHFKHERLQRRDLMRLTWTTKHRWFQKGERNRRELVRGLKKERPYL